MSIIEEFCKKALTETNSFTITSEDRDTKLFLVPATVGTAKYIYGARSFYDDNFYTSLDTKLKPIAIVSDDTVYVIDSMFLEVSPSYLGYSDPGKTLPPSAVYIEGEFKKRLEIIESVLLPEYNSTLEPIEITDSNTLYICKKRVRKALFTDNNPYYMDTHISFNIQDVADILCGFMDFEAEIKRRMDEANEKLVLQKSMNLLIKQMMEDNTAANTWEIALGRSLKNSNAKYVTVHFDYNGLSESGKMEPSTILRRLEENSAFSYYSFETYSKGEKVLNNLGIVFHSEELKCEHISKVTHGKAILYEK